MNVSFVSLAYLVNPMFITSDTLAFNSVKLAKTEFLHLYKN